MFHERCAMSCLKRGGWRQLVGICGCLGGRHAIEAGGMRAREFAGKNDGVSSSK